MCGMWLLYQLKFYDSLQSVYFATHHIDDIFRKNSMGALRIAIARLAEATASALSELLKSSLYFQKGNQLCLLTFKVNTPSYRSQKDLSNDIVA